MNQNSCFRFKGSCLRSTRTLLWITAVGLFCVLIAGSVRAQCDANFAGTYARADGTSTVTISGSGSSLTATEEWAAGGRNGTNNWSNCQVTGNTIKCKWTGVYRGDPDKTADRKGTVTGTLNGDKLTGTFYEDEPTFHWNVAPYPSAIHKGATFELNSIRKGGAPPPCTAVAPDTTRTPASSVSRSIARVVASRGDVSISRNGGSFVDMTAGTELHEGDDVSTGPDSEVTVTFADGSTMLLEPNTQISVASLYAQRNSIRVRMNLKLGAIAAKVNKSQTAVSDYSVKTPTATASVRGTAFTVQYDKQTQATTVAVEEGVVQITPNNARLRPLALRAGQQVQVAQTRVGPITGTSVPTVTSARVSTQNLSGTWIMEDGRVVQVTQQGNLVRWNFHGSWSQPSQDRFTVTVSGTFDGKHFAGSFENHAENYSAKGRIELTLTGNRLEGSWESVTNAGRSGKIAMTRR